MHKCLKEEEWLFVKYGKLMKPWEITLRFKNQWNNSSGTFIQGNHDEEIAYEYSFKNQPKSIYDNEREPHRHI